MFSAIGLKQIKERREGGRGLALTGLILSIIFVLIADPAIAVLALTVFKPAVEKAQSESVRRRWRPATSPPADDPTGVVAACEVIVPAVVDLETDLSTRRRPPRSYATVMGDLRTTMEAAAGQTTDPDVHRATCRRCRTTSSRRSTP